MQINPWFYYILYNWNIFPRKHIYLGSKENLILTLVFRLQQCCKTLKKILLKYTKSNTFNVCELINAFLNYCAGWNFYYKYNI